MARSRDHFCNGNAAMYSLCIVELNLSINFVKILSVEQKYFMVNVCSRQQ
jgi:hypothetical protein